jgi:hypothetical protein
MEIVMMDKKKLCHVAMSVNSDPKLVINKKKSNANS